MVPWGFVPDRLWTHLRALFSDSVSVTPCLGVGWVTGYLKPVIRLRVMALDLGGGQHDGELGTAELGKVGLSLPGPDRETRQSPGL